jgi:hypothetical protein
MSKTKRKQIGKTHAVELANVDDLKPHPQNYREHPDDQVDHVVESIRANGFYRNVVVAKDNTILAGHGVVKAARKAGITKVPVVRLNVRPDDPNALKVLVGDNEIARLAETNDRQLAEMLEAIKAGPGLKSTGFVGEEVDALLAKLKDAPPGQFPAFDENLPIHHKCPKCGYAWSGKPNPTG